LILTLTTDPIIMNEIIMELFDLSWYDFVTLTCLNQFQTCKVLMLFMNHMINLFL